MHSTILQTYLTQLKSGTISDYFLGPIYRAMEEGRPIIIDEVNAIPHEILISLNHILTRRPGDVVSVQQDSGRQVAVKNGFGVLMTGNLNQGQERYVGRQEMDPAFLSRLYKVDYDYPPQKIEGSLEDEAGPENQLFHLLLAKVMDTNGNIEVPEGSIPKLWNLAKAARASQDIFSGRDLGNSYYFRQAGGMPTPYYLKESVLSLRSLNSIVSQWQKDGYRYELDHYVWEEFINQSTSQEDRAFLYQMFKDRFGFFSSQDKWPTPNYGQAGMVRSFSVDSPKNKTEAQEFFGPRETVEFAFGKNAPEREEWPGGIKNSDIESKKNSESINSNQESGSQAVSVEEAEQIMGRELFHGPEDIEKVFLSPFQLEEIPPIPFSRAELMRALQLGQQLILQVDEMYMDSDSGDMKVPITLENLKARFTESHDNTPYFDPVAQSSIQEADFFKNEKVRSGWVLTSKDVVPNSTSKSYLQQTQVLVDYIRGEVFKGAEVPGIYQDAINEFEAQKDELGTLRGGQWKILSERLGALKINQLLRERPVEVFSRIILHDQSRHEKLLFSNSTWTSTLSSGSNLVGVGGLGDGGLRVWANFPHSESETIGVSLSRRF
jgi:hypothetical protein